jgi:hypothetical protein
MKSTHSSDESNVTSKGLEKEIMPAEASHNSVDGKISAEEGLGGDEVKYPGGYQLLLICVAICLAIFLVALVRRESSPRRTDRIQPQTATSTDQSTGQQYHSHSHPEDHCRLPFTPRRRLVCLSLPFDDLLLRIDVWQILHLLQHQMGLPNCLRALRSGLARLRCSPQLDCPNRGTCYCRRRCSRNLHWRLCDHRMLSSDGKTSCLHWNARRYVRDCECGWASNGRCFQ